MDIGNALLKARKRRGLRQGEVAKRVDITQSYLSQIESGAKIPSIEVVDTLAKEYGMPFPIMLWGSLTEKDVKRDKIVIYNKLKPTIDTLINDIFG